MLKKGEKAPDFSLPDDSNNIVSLSQFKGKKVIVYFYPKDNTPGCTKEACSFRDDYSEILKNGAVVIGISADSVKSHQSFKSKYQLPFYLLSDTDKKVITQYNAYGEKNMYGKKVWGIIRSTFIIDENGIIMEVFPKVTPEGHSKEILNLL